MKFRRIPEVVDAEEFQLGKKIEGVKLWAEVNTVTTDNSVAFLDTKKGHQHIQIGDWIVTGIKGEKRVLRPADFWKTYERIN